MRTPGPGLTPDPLPDPNPRGLAVWTAPRPVRARAPDQAYEDPGHFAGSPGAGDPHRPSYSDQALALPDFARVLVAT